MSTPKPTERQLVARLAAHESWVRTPDRTARTAPARNAFLAKFEDLVDPRQELLPDERARRAVNARKAHFTRLALRSVQSRRSASSQRTALAELGEATALLAEATQSSSDPSEGTQATCDGTPTIDAANRSVAVSRSVR